MAFSNSILSGTTLAREAIQSEGFQTGVQGWRIERDGDAEFQDIIARGDVEASKLDVFSDPAEGHVVIDPTAFNEADTPTIEFSDPADNFGAFIFRELGDDVGSVNGITYRSRLRLTSGNESFGDTITFIDILSAPLIRTVSINGGINAGEMRPTESTGTNIIDISGSANYVQSTLVSRTFVARASGVARIDFTNELRIRTNANGSRSAFASIAVREGSSIGSGTVVLNFADAHAASISAGNLSGAHGQGNMMGYVIVTGLTPGDTYHALFGYRVGTTSAVALADSLKQRITVTPQM